MVYGIINIIPIQAADLKYISIKLFEDTTWFGMVVNSVYNNASIAVSTK